MFKLPHGSIAIALMLGLAPTALVACSTTQPVHTQMSDARITASVKSRFAADPTVSAMNINVTTEEGVVILAGRVKSAKEKAEAERLASKVDGVKDVKNLLEVGDKTP
jgi:osmotically-inducible protein OsmY